MHTLRATAAAVAALLGAARPPRSPLLFCASATPSPTLGLSAGPVAAAASWAAADWGRSAALSAGTNATGSGRRGGGAAGASCSRMVAVGVDETKIINDVVSARSPCETRLPASHMPAIASAAILPPPPRFPSTLRVPFDLGTCMPCLQESTGGRSLPGRIRCVSELPLLITPTCLPCPPERPH